MRDLREDITSSLPEDQRWGLTHRTCSICEVAGKIVTAEFVLSSEGGWSSVCFHCLRDLQRAAKESDPPSQLKVNRMFW